VALESLLATHPDILECAVVAIQDEKWGERPKAFITLKDGQSVTGQEVISWAKSNKSISNFMVPAEVEILDDLPKTSTGKTKKVVLREWAKTGQKKE
jgi:acyl-coenzyme A synthetase/AMP-(fatty) acid ligase